MVSAVTLLDHNVNFSFPQNLFEFFKRSYFPKAETLIVQLNEMLV